MRNERPRRGALPPSRGFQLHAAAFPRLPASRGRLPEASSFTRPPSRGFQLHAAAFPEESRGTRRLPEEPASDAVTKVNDMSILNSLNRVADGIFELVGGPASSYCRLESLDDFHTLCASDGSLVTAFAVEGTPEPVSDALAASAAEALSGKTRAIFERGGHFVKAVFDYDPDAGPETVRGMMAPARRAASECGLDMGRTLDGWESALGGLCARESLAVTLWTTFGALAPAERGKAARAFAEAGAGGILEGAAELRSAHGGAVSARSEGLRQAGLKARVMPARRLVRDIRAAMYGPTVPPDWEPRLPGDPFPLVCPEPGGEA
ncbi:MAG: hypothetical protein LBT40_12765, partial [Deltaproteobacteria bacterium]|nr:hypothetical protein [Deltaproteobacteria bacterium]